ncbi:MAG: septation protein A [Thiotrichaceae bacterium]|nr:septation protein A [Thiotrichaceae bacterium]
MKLLFDFLPILLFFIAYKVYDIYVATAVIIVASTVQVFLFWLKYHRIEKMHVVTLVLVLLLGGATLYFHNATFIYWKPTIVNWAFAIVFLGSQFIGQKNMLQRMLDGQVVLTSQIAWKHLNFAWVAFFVGMGAINIYVAFNFDENTWVNFKLFGMMGLTILFIIAQSVYLARHIVPDDKGDTKNPQP